MDEDSVKHDTKQMFQLQPLPLKNGGFLVPLFCPSSFLCALEGLLKVISGHGQSGQIRFIQMNNLGIKFK